MLVNWIYMYITFGCVLVHVRCWKSPGNSVNIGRPTTYTQYASQSMMAQWYCEICKLHNWTDCLRTYCHYYFWGIGGSSGYGGLRLTVVPTYYSRHTMEQWYCDVCSSHGLTECVQHYCKYRYSGIGGGGYGGYYGYGQHFNKFNKHTNDANSINRQTVVPTYYSLHMWAQRYCEICELYSWTECVPRHCNNGYSGTGGRGYGGYYGYGRHLKRISTLVKKTSPN